jgi:hypothetical protein
MVFAEEIGAWKAAVKIDKRHGRNTVTPLGIGSIIVGISFARGFRIWSAGRGGRAGGTRCSPRWPCLIFLLDLRRQESFHPRGWHLVSFSSAYHFFFAVLPLWLLFFLRSDH